MLRHLLDRITKLGSFHASRSLELSERDHVPQRQDGNAECGPVGHERLRGQSSGEADGASEVKSMT